MLRTVIAVAPLCSISSVRTAISSEESTEVDEYVEYLGRICQTLSAVPVFGWLNIQAS